MTGEGDQIADYPLVAAPLSPEPGMSALQRFSKVASILALFQRKRPGRDTGYDRRYYKRP